MLPRPLPFSQPATLDYPRTTESSGMQVREQSVGSWKSPTLPQDRTVCPGPHHGPHP